MYFSNSIYFFICLHRIWLFWLSHYLIMIYVIINLGYHHIIPFRILTLINVCDQLTII